MSARRDKVTFGQWRGEPETEAMYGEWAVKWLRRSLLVVLVFLSVISVARADYSVSRNFGVGTVVVVGGTASQACSYYGLVDFTQTSTNAPYPNWWHRQYTTYSGSGCDVYLDSGRTQYLETLGVTNCGTSCGSSNLLVSGWTTGRLVDGWCNDVASCANAGYVGGVSGGSGGTTSVNVSFPDVFNIDSAGGAQIGGAILLLWSVAFCVRLVIAAVRETDEPSSPFNSD